MDRNTVLALVLTALIFIGFQVFVEGPRQEQLREYRAAQAALEAEQGGALSNPDGLPIATEIANLSRDDAIAAAPGRVPIETPSLQGSINLHALTFDDIVLRGYNETVEDDSPMVTLLSPANVAGSQFIRSGLAINGDRGADLVWSAPDNAMLTPDTPVTFTRPGAVDGVEHTATISVDEQYMFTIEHAVINRSGTDITVSAYGATFQRGVPDHLRNFMILFEGPLSFVGSELISRKYKKLQDGEAVNQSGIGGWVGITDKHWLSAAIPPQDQNFQARISGGSGASPTFISAYGLNPINVPDGTMYPLTTHVFAGAKEVDVLQRYEAALGISNFDRAVDWGFMFFLTRPIFFALHFFAGLVGNYGIAIMLLTLLIKAILFPLANMSYKSMAGMRKAQPEMKILRERYKDDQMRMQQEMMKLYKKHNINVAAGCLPILAQMPIFFALYKTLFVTIDSRHEPFLWIRDLAERDPTSIFNLFGLLPFEPTSIPVIGGFLGLGVLPILMGIGMWVQFRLNPPPADPTQKMIFGIMPWIFMIMFAPFAAGLVLYWSWNTFLGLVQQYYIMKRHGAEVDLIGNIRESIPFLKPKPAAANENNTSE